MFLSWLGRAAWHESGIEHLIPSVFAGEHTANLTTISGMPLLKSLRGCGSGTEGRSGFLLGRQIPQAANTITVCAVQPEIEHKVKIDTFKTWLARTPKGPADAVAQAKVRDILR